MPRIHHHSPEPRLAGLVLAITLLAALLLPADEVVRIMAANLTSGNGQSYDQGAGNRIFQGLQPDIVLLQEFRYGDNSEAAIRGWVDAQFGSTFEYFREEGGGIPNGVISRYPILASGEWSDSNIADRDFAWAKIDVPGSTPLWAVSVHFKASSGSANVSRRNAQAAELKSYLEQSIPAGDFIVIGGDFNTQNHEEECLAILSPLVASSAPYPADQNGNTHTNANRNRPYDRVLPSLNLQPFSTPLTLHSNTFPNGLVFDSRVYAPLSELPPILPGDSGTDGMQHMAVMRAFLLPTEEEPTLYQTWLNQHFSPLLEEETERRWGPLADPDGDGTVNLLEFAMGTDPLRQDHAPALLEVQSTLLDGARHATLLLQIRLDGEHDALRYTIQWSHHLTDWEDLPAEEVSLVGEESAREGWNTRTLLLTEPISSSPKRFFRLALAERPESSPASGE